VTVLNCIVVSSISNLNSNRPPFCPVKEVTLLHVTSEHGILSAVEALLAGTAFNVNSVNSKNRTALSYAAAHGHEEVVETWLKMGAEANLDKMESRPPLYYALRVDKPRVVELLLKNSIDSHTTKRSIRKWLWYAARNG